MVATGAPGDLREELIHSLQKYVEVYEPEAEPVPMIASPKTAGDEDGDVAFDRTNGERTPRSSRPIDRRGTRCKPDPGSAGAA